MGLKTQLSADGKELSLCIDGRFDFNLHMDFREAYRGLPPDTRYVIDLSRTTFMDSSAMGMLLLLREYAGEKHADIRLCNCSEAVRKVLAVSHLDSIFAIE